MNAIVVCKQVSFERALCGRLSALCNSNEAITKIKIIKCRNANVRLVCFFQVFLKECKDESVIVDLVVLGGIPK